MATIWITYAWADNENNDVDYVIQELRNYGVEVKIDRWSIQAGKRLWEQIANFITNPKECDAWLIYVTPNSLGSEACKEEFAYALDRALQSRGNTFPVIGICPTSMDNNLIPPGIRTRLYVSLNDPDWKERIKSTAEGRAPAISYPPIQPYFIKIYNTPTSEGMKYQIEVRPRAGTWSPFIAGIPIDEKDYVKPTLLYGPSGRKFTGNFMLYNCVDSTSKDGNWWVLTAGNEATTTQSYFIHCHNLPSKFVFGVENGSPIYLIENFSREFTS